MARNEIIFITGSLASGKDTGAAFIEQEYDYMHVSTSDMVRKAALKLDGDVSREALSVVADTYRSQFGAGFFCVEALRVYHEQKSTKTNGLVITGARSSGEILAVRNVGGITGFIDAPVEERFKRYISRSRAGDSFRSLDEFVAFEEMEASGQNGKTQDMDVVRSLADVVIMNDSSREDLFKRVSLLVFT
jgi:dephospho-CoA kinase